jgi:hypothetical protein
VRHDPQRTAAAYLGGQLPRRHRDRFEAHLLACEDCWGEVRAGRRGRALAEGSRELPPSTCASGSAPRSRRPPLRPPRWRPRRWVAVTSLAVAAVLGGGLLAVREPRAQPASIAAAVASYQPAAGAGAGRPVRRPPNSSVACAGAAPATARSAASRWCTPTRTPPATGWCCCEPTARSRQRSAPGTPRPAPPGSPRSTAWCCFAPTSRHRRCCSARTRPKSSSRPPCSAWTKPGTHPRREQPVASDRTAGGRLPPGSGHGRVARDGTVAAILRTCQDRGRWRAVPRLPFAIRPGSVPGPRPPDSGTLPVVRCARRNDDRRCRAGEVIDSRSPVVTVQDSAGWADPAAAVARATGFPSGSATHATRSPQNMSSGALSSRTSPSRSAARVASTLST